MGKSASRLVVGPSGGGGGGGGRGGDGESGESTGKINYDNDELYSSAQPESSLSKRKRSHYQPEKRLNPDLSMDSRVKLTMSKNHFTVATFRETSQQQADEHRASPQLAGDSCGELSNNIHGTASLGSVGEKGNIQSGLGAWRQPPVALVKLRQQQQHQPMRPPPQYVAVCEQSRASESTDIAAAVAGNCCNYANCFMSAIHKSSAPNERQSINDLGPEVGARLQIAKPSKVMVEVASGETTKTNTFTAKRSIASAVKDQALAKDELVVKQKLQVVDFNEEKLSNSQLEQKLQVRSGSRGGRHLVDSTLASKGKGGGEEGKKSAISSGRATVDRPSAWYKELGLAENNQQNLVASDSEQKQREEKRRHQQQQQQIQVQHNDKSNLTFSNHQNQPILEKLAGNGKIGDEKLEPNDFQDFLNTSSTGSTTSSNPSSSSRSSHHLAWKDIANRYGKMPRKLHRANMGMGLKNSCFARLASSLLFTLFPILNSFKGYSLPGDLTTDLLAGLTIGILHIPQGMAYGLLAGAEPIYGLYTSLIPVTIMALMSKSRHVSYGTFAIISMLLSNTIENVKLSLIQEQQLVKLHQQQQATATRMTETPTTSNQNNRIMGQILTEQPPPPVGVPTAAALIITDNHNPNNYEHQSIDSQMNSQILKNYIVSKSRAGNQISLEDFAPPIGANGLPLSLVPSAATQSPNEPQIQITDFVLPSNIEILTCVCLFVGLIQITMALMRLGHLSLMFSDQLVSSFTCAAAIHVVTSQVGGLFDMTLPSISDETFKIYHTWRGIYLELSKGNINQYTAMLSACSILFLLIIKELIEPKLRKRYKWLTNLPSELMLMIFVILASWYWKFYEQLDIKIIGQVPTGLPAPQVPRLDLIPYLTEDAITVALVSFAMNLSLAQVYAKKYKYKIEPNQELLSLGSSNLVSSFFSCFPCGSSLSRTAVQSALNVRSQLSALFSCAIVLSIICFFAPILHDLPRSTLSCIIVVALKGILVQIRDFYENWRLSKLDASVWVVTFASVLLFGVTYGLLLGIAASLFMIFFR